MSFNGPPLPPPPEARGFLDMEVARFERTEEEHWRKEPDRFFAVLRSGLRLFAIPIQHCELRFWVDYILMSAPLRTESNIFLRKMRFPPMLTMYNCLIVPSYSTSSCQNVAINMRPGTISVFFWRGDHLDSVALDVRFKQIFMITIFLYVLFYWFFAICLSGWFGIFSLHNTLDCGCLSGDSGNKRAFWAFQPRRRMDGEGLVIHTVNVWPIDPSAIWRHRQKKIRLPGARTHNRSVPSLWFRISYQSMMAK